MSCPDCFKGFLRTDKEPAGTIDTVYGLPTYISPARTPGPAKGIIVIIPDAFGWEFVNNLLLADAYAAAGFRVYLPDFMDGLAVPVYFLESVERLTSTSSWWDWVYKPYDLFWIACGIVPFTWKNYPTWSHPRVVQFFEKLKTTPMENDVGLKVGVAGFCWGGKHAIMLSHKEEAHLIDAVFTAHPSILTMPSDIECVTKPVSVAVGEKDSWMPIELARQTEKILKRLEGEVEGMKSEVVVYPDAAHGFSIRIDIKNPKQVEQSQQAEEQATRWFERIFKS